MANDLPALPELTPTFPVDAFQPGKAGVPFQEKIIRQFAQGDTPLKLDAVETFSNQSIADAGLEVLKNFGAEARDLIIGIPLIGVQAIKKAVSAVGNPIDTLESLASGEALKDLENVVGEFLAVVGEDYKERWGPLFEGEFLEFAEKSKDRPLSFLLDLTAALSLAGGAMKTAGAAMAETAAAEGLKTTGTTLSAIGRSIDPMIITGKTLSKAGDLVPGLPIIGKTARDSRMLRNQTKFLTIDEIDKAVPKIRELTDNFNHLYEGLSAEEQALFAQYNWRIIPKDSARLSSQFDKTMAKWQEIQGWGEEAFGINHVEAARRRVLPVIQKKLADGTMEISDSLRPQLERFATPLEGGGIQLTAGSVMDLPKQLFDEAANTLDEWERTASYFPMIAAEQKMSTSLSFNRLSPKQQTTFKESYTGTVFNQLRKAKFDPAALADSKEVVRVFINDAGKAEAMMNVMRKLQDVIDPATGEKLLKPIFLGGRLPNNIGSVPDGKVAALILNTMKKPAKGTFDDIYKEVLGMTQAEHLNTIKLGKSVTQATRRNSERLLKQALDEAGFDGYFVNKGKDIGRFSVLDESLLPFAKQEGHVIWHPAMMKDMVRKQRNLAKQMHSSLDVTESIQSATEAAFAKVFPEGDQFFKVQEELLNASKSRTNVLNSDLIDEKQLRQFTKEMKDGLRSELKDLGFDTADMRKMMSKYGREVKKNLSKTAPNPSKFYWAWQIPEDTARMITGQTPPVNNTVMKFFLDDTLNTWRMAVLNFSGRWHVNNILGNTMLNLAAGVLNPIDYLRAGRLLAYDLGKRFPRAIGMPREAIRKIIGVSDETLSKAKELHDLIPESLRTGSFIRAENYALRNTFAAESPFGRMHSWLADQTLTRPIAKGFTGLGKIGRASADFNAVMDEYFRNANFLSQVRGRIRSESKGVIKKIAKTFYVSQDEITDSIRRMNDVSRSNIVKSVNKWLPDYRRLLSDSERRFVRRVIPFWSWYRHMIGVGFMMPFNHPARTAFIRDLSRISKDAEEDEFRRAGLDPNDVKLVADYLEASTIIGKGKRGPKFLSLRGLNPFHTLLEIPNIGNAMRPEIKAAIEQMTHKDLFTGREFNKRIVVGSDGVPREEYDRNLVDAAIRNVPQAELIKRLINPEITDVAGEVVFRRDRALEILKMMGANVSERDIDQIKERAAKRRGNLANRAFNILLQSKRKSPEPQLEILDFIMGQGG